MELQPGRFGSSIRQRSALSSYVVLGPIERSFRRERLQPSRPQRVRR
jgi:hypothetical protein